MIDVSRSARHDGGGERPEGRLWLWLTSLVFLGFITLPLVALVAAAVPARPLRRLGDPVALDALRLSPGTSLVATALCILLGLPVAYLLARFRFRGQGWLDTLI